MQQKQERLATQAAASPAIQKSFSEALQHYQAGRFDAAERLCQQVLAANPRHGDSVHLLGLLAAQTGRSDAAAELLTNAISINPSAPLYRYSLGNLRQHQTQLDEAVDCYRSVIALDPNFAAAHCNLGITLYKQGRPDEAVASYHTALARKPEFFEAYNGLGVALHKLEQLDEAVASLRSAIALNPDAAHAHNNLGVTLQAQGLLDDAIASFHKAIELKPDFAEAYNNLADAFEELERLDEAIACCRKARELQPRLPEAYLVLGRICKKQGRLDHAIACFRTAIEFRSDYAEAHAALALALLTRGELPAGWREYEWRWQTSDMRKLHREFAQPRWQGEAATGRTLLIHAEQGYGDTVQFCRYALLAAARGLRIIMEVPKPLVRLMRSLPLIDRVVARGEPLPAFDLHCPMLSLPLVFGTTLTNIPSATAYLRADPARVAAWRERLAALPNKGRRIGLVWAGNPKLHLPKEAAIDRRRSLAPDRLASLFTVPGLHFFSLQKTGPAMPAEYPVTDFMDEMDDFADTAALVANLDLIISVDTAVAHLAAALGTPVWLLDRFDPCWRWLEARRDSPWYPTLRLYRQPIAGDWPAVLAAITQDLHEFAAQPSNCPPLNNAPISIAPPGPGAE